MKLKKILNELNVNCLLDEDIKIRGFTRNIDEIEEGFIYFSFDDINVNKFKDIRKRGASYVIGSSNYFNNYYSMVLDVKKTYQMCLQLFYGYKFKNKTLIGVTGTNGKTTISTIIYNFLKENGNSIYFGSNGIFKNDKVIPLENTTPSMEVILKNLDNEKYVVVEISSISFFEYRLFDIKFDYLILSNIYEDHLEYHKKIEDYIYSKFLILATNFDAKALICEDVSDKRVLRLNKYSYIYGINNGIVKISNIKEETYCTKLIISYKNSDYHVSTNLLGVYNLKNISAAINLFLLMGFKITSVINYLNKPINILGRQNIFKYKSKTIIVDYPHTASSYEISLNMYNKIYKRIIVVYGAGGNREKSKRELYSKFVSKYAMYAILTNDNPRDEDEMEILCDLQKNLNIPFEIIKDRKKAIDRALSLLEGFSLLLVLGKGNENYICTNKENISHNDINYIRSIVK